MTWIEVQANESRQFAVKTRFNGLKLHLNIKQLWNAFEMKLVIIKKKLKMWRNLPFYTSENYFLILLFECIWIEISSETVEWNVIK